jgi:hypothetical protein
MKSIGLIIAAGLGFSAYGAEKCKVTFGGCKTGDELLLMKYRDHSNSYSEDHCNELPLPCDHTSYEAWLRQSQTSSRTDLSTGQIYYGELDSKGNYIALKNQVIRKCFLKNSFLGRWREVMVKTCQFDTASTDSGHSISPPPPGSNTGGILTSLGQLAQQASEGSSLASQISPSTLDFTQPQQEALIHSPTPYSYTGSPRQEASSLPSQSRVALGRASSSGGTGASSAAPSSMLTSASTGGISDSSLTSTDKLPIIKEDDSVMRGGSGVTKNSGSSEGNFFDMSRFMEASQTGEASQDAEALEAGSRGRGIASLGIEDPADYFTRVGIEENLFKKVSRRYSDHERSWILTKNRPKN